MKILRLASIALVSANTVGVVTFFVLGMSLTCCYGQTTGRSRKTIKFKPKKTVSAKKEKIKDAEFPPFDQVVITVQKHLKSIKGYKKNDLISRDQIQSVFPKLKKLGWKVADSKNILKRILPSNHFLVRQLRSSQGKRFMRKMNTKTQSFSYLHRLSRMPHGQKRVHELIRGPDGYKLLLYFSDSKYGRKTGEMISRGKNGKNFNKPTGVIYTGKQFLAALRKSYTHALKEWKKKKKNVEKKPKKKSTGKNTI